MAKAQHAASSVDAELAAADQEYARLNASAKGARDDIVGKLASYAGEAGQAASKNLGALAQELRLLDECSDAVASMIKLQRSVVQLTEASSVFQNPAAPGSATAPTMKDMQAAVSALATTRKLAADAAASSRTVTGLGAAFSSVLIAVEKAEHSVRARAAAHMQRHLSAVGWPPDLSTAKAKAGTPEWALTWGHLSVFAGNAEAHEGVARISCILRALQRVLETSESHQGGGEEVEKAATEAPAPDWAAEELVASLRSRLAFHFQSGRDGGRSHASGMAQALGCARACASLVVPCVDPIAAEMARLGDTRASKSLRPMVLRALARATGSVLRDHLEALAAEGVTPMRVATELLALDCHLAVSLGLDAEWAGAGRDAAGRGCLGDVPRALGPGMSASGSAVGHGQALAAFLAGCTRELALRATAAFDAPDAWSPLLTAADAYDGTTRGGGCAGVALRVPSPATHASDALAGLLSTCVTWAAALDEDAVRMSAIADMAGAVVKAALARLSREMESAAAYDEWVTGHWGARCASCVCTAEALAVALDELTLDGSVAALGNPQPITQHARACRRFRDEWCGRIGAGLASHVIRDMAPWKAACKARYTALSFDVTYSAAPELTRALATLSDSLEALCAHYDPVTLREVLRALLPTLTVDIFNTVVTEHEFSSAGAANYESDVTAIATTAQANLPGAWGYMRELWDAAGLLCAPLSQGRQAIAMLTQGLKDAAPREQKELLQSLGVERLTVEQAIAVLSQKLVEYDEQGNELEPSRPQRSGVRGGLGGANARTAQVFMPPPSSGRPSLSTPRNSQGWPSALEGADRAHTHTPARRGPISVDEVRDVASRDGSAVAAAGGADAALGDLAVSAGASQALAESNGIPSLSHWDGTGQSTAWGDGEGQDGTQWQGAEGGAWSEAAQGAGWSEAGADAAPGWGGGWGGADGGVAEGGVNPAGSVPATGVSSVDAGYEHDPDYVRGAYRDDSNRDEAPRDGAYADEGYADGTYQDGAYADGTYQDGAYQNGAYQEGSYQEGAYPADGPMNAAGWWGGQSGGVEAYGETGAEGGGWGAEGYGYAPEDGYMPENGDVQGWGAGQDSQGYAAEGYAADMGPGDVGQGWGAGYASGQYVQQEGGWGAVGEEGGDGAVAGGWGMQEGEEGGAGEWGAQGGEEGGAWDGGAGAWDGGGEVADVGGVAADDGAAGEAGMGDAGGEVERNGAEEEGAGEGWEGGEGGEKEGEGLSRGHVTRRAHFPTNATVLGSDNAWQGSATPPESPGPDADEYVEGYGEDGWAVDERDPAWGDGTWSGAGAQGHSLGDDGADGAGPSGVQEWGGAGAEGGEVGEAVVGGAKGIDGYGEGAGGGSREGGGDNAAAAQWGAEAGAEGGQGCAAGQWGGEGTAEGDAPQWSGEGATEGGEGAGVPAWGGEGWGEGKPEDLPGAGDGEVAAEGWNGWAQGGAEQQGAVGWGEGAAEEGEGWGQGGGGEEGAAWGDHAQQAWGGVQMDGQWGESQGWAQGQEGGDAVGGAGMGDAGDGAADVGGSNDDAARTEAAPESAVAGTDGPHEGHSGGHGWGDRGDADEYGGEGYGNDDGIAKDQGDDRVPGAGERRAGAVPGTVAGPGGACRAVGGCEWVGRGDGDGRRVGRGEGRCGGFGV